MPELANKSPLLDLSLASRCFGAIPRRTEFAADRSKPRATLRGGKIVFDLNCVFMINAQCEYILFEMMQDGTRALGSRAPGDRPNSQWVVGRLILFLNCRSKLGFRPGVPQVERTATSFIAVGSICSGPLATAASSIRR